MDLNSSLWKTFVEEGRDVNHLELNEYRKLIVEGWNISRKKKQNPFIEKISKPRNVKTGSNELANEFFARTRETIENAIDWVDKGIAWVICDKKGIVNGMVSCDEEYLEELKAKGIHWGQNLTLAHAGVNGVGMAIKETRLCLCVGKHHYLKILHDQNSSGVHLCDIKGEIIAYLGVFCRHEFGFRNLNTMLRLIVKNLDTRGRLDRSTKLHTTSRDRINLMFSQEESPVMLFSPDGQLKQANGKAIALFNIRRNKGERIISYNANFKPSIEEMSSSSIREELDVSYKDIRKKMKFLCQKIPCYDNSDHFIGVILVFASVGKKEFLKNSMAHSAQYTFDEIIGDSPQLNRAINLAKQIAKSNINVLITGESGTGKEVFAQSIHNGSDYASGPFISLNCSAIPKELAESELFGYVKGAFTGALNEGKSGVLEQANNGTLFLDEIGDMPLDLQVKLLRAIENKTITRLGSEKEIRINFRIIAATNRNLERMVNNKRFREDLFYRLAVGSISLPSLRECKDNVIDLFNNFLQNFSKISGKDVKLKNPKIINKLKEYSWKGNIRELKNAAEFAVMMNSRNEELTLEHLPGRMRITILYQSNQVHHSDIPVQNMIETNSPRLSRHLEDCLNQTGWNINETAKLMNVSRATLYRRMNKKGLLKRDVFQ